jgi:hypothetical protein
VHIIDADTNKALLPERPGTTCSATLKTSSPPTPLLCLLGSVSLLTRNVSAFPSRWLLFAPASYLSRLNDKHDEHIFIRLTRLVGIVVVYTGAGDLPDEDGKESVAKRELRYIFLDFLFLFLAILPLKLSPSSATLDGRAPDGTVILPPPSSIPPRRPLLQRATSFRPFLLSPPPSSFPAVLALFLSPFLLHRHLLAV